MQVRAGPSTQQVFRQRDSDRPRSWQHGAGQCYLRALARAMGKRRQACSGGEGTWVPLKPGNAVGHPMQGWASHPRRSRERLKQAQGISSLPTLARVNTDTSGWQRMGAVGRN